MKTPNDTQPEEQHLAELLRGAYRPVDPDPTFAANLRAKMLAVAPKTVAPRRRRLPLVLSSLAAAAILFLTTFLVVQNAGKHPDKVKPSPQPDTNVVVAPFSSQLRHPRTVTASAPASVAVADMLKTEAHETRVFTLPDDSRLYLDQLSAVTVSAPRRLEMDHGRLYVEVAKREGERFSIRAAGRTITALGTRFVVEIVPSGAMVSVTEGTVDVDGITVVAGQRLELGSTKAIPAPSATRLLDWCAEAMGSCQGILVPASGDDGGLWVDGPTGPVALELRRQHIDVHIEDGFARTTVDLSFFNHLAWRQEGTFVFPLPTDAAISRLAMYVDGNLREAALVERDKARNAYETIVNRQKDPALLEWLDGSSFRLRVFPIEAKQVKRLILSYTQRLKYDDGRRTWRFPGGRSLGRVKDWSCHARVVEGKDLLWESPSHEFIAGADAADRILDAKESNVAPTRDVVIRLDEYSPEHREPTIIVQNGNALNDPGHEYWLLRTRLADLPRPEKERRTWVVLVETSADRDPVLAGAQLAWLDAFRRALPAQDEMRYLAANLEPVWTTREGLNSAHLVGALDLGKAFDSLAKGCATTSGKPWILHLGGGNPSYGERDVVKLCSRLPAGVPYVGVGMGRAWNRALMRKAAAASGGWAAQVNPDENLVWNATEVFHTLRAGRMTGLTVDAGTGITFLPFDDDLTAQDEFLAAARVPVGTALVHNVILRGRAEGQNQERSLKLTRQDGALYLPRTWARLELDRLVAAGAEKKDIVALGTAQHLLTPFTSLMVFESEAQEKEFNVERREVAHWAHYPAPAHIELQSEGEVIAGLDPRLAKRPSQNEVLATVVQGHQGGWSEPFQDGWLTNLSGSPRTSLKTRQNVKWTVWPNRASGKIHPFGFDGPGTQGLEKLPRSMENSGDLEDIKVVRMYYSSSGSPTPRGRAFRRVRASEIEFGRGIFHSDPMPCSGFPSDSISSILSRADFDAMAGSLPYIDNRFLANLTLLAPGLGTLSSDAADVLESEARPDGSQLPGRIDAAATVLIERARSAGAWIRVTLPADATGSAWELSVHASGCFVGERRLPCGLREEVRCDGTRLWLIYPDLGLAAERRLGSHLFATWQQDLPFIVSPPEHLRQGNHVLTEGENSVLLVPVTATNGGIHLVQRLTFDSQSRLVTRSLMERPSGAILAEERIAYQHSAIEGNIIVSRSEGKNEKVNRTIAFRGLIPVPPMIPPSIGVEPTVTKHVWKIDETWQDLAFKYYSSTSSALANRIEYANPNFAFKAENVGKIVVIPPKTDQTNGLVVLPMPGRSQEHLAKQAMHTDLRYGAQHWPDATARAMAATRLIESNYYASDVIGSRLARGDHRLGWYVLLFAAQPTQRQNGLTTLNNFTVRVNLNLVHPDMPVSAYISRSIQRRNWQSDRRRDGRDTQKYELPNYRVNQPTGFLSILDSLDELEIGINGGWLGPVQGQTLARTVVEGAGELAWVQLALRRCLDLSAQTEGSELAVRAHARFPDDVLISWMLPVLQSTACLLNPPRENPIDQHLQMLDPSQANRERKISPIQEFAPTQAVWENFLALYSKLAQTNDAPPMPLTWSDLARAAGKTEDLSAYLRTTGEKLLSAGKIPAVIRLAWQTRLLGFEPLAEELFARARVAATTDADQVSVLRWLWHTNAKDQALTLVRSLIAGAMKTEDLQRQSSLRLLEAGMLDALGRPDQALRAREIGVGLMLDSLGETWDPTPVRTECQRLLSAYSTLAAAQRRLGMKVDTSIVHAALSAVDRWREREADQASACFEAASLFTTMGRPDLGWAYRSSVLALAPGQSQAWISLAQELGPAGDIDGADRAWRVAFELEPTNARILQLHADALQHHGRQAQARERLKLLAEGTWQERFKSEQDQARKTFLGLQ